MKYQRDHLSLKAAQATGQLAGVLSQQLGLGSGSVLPGRIGLLLEPNLLESARSLMKQGCLFVTGTNGKSTTVYYLNRVLKQLGYSTCTNWQGANMTSGLASACLQLKESVDYGIFEVDEAYVPILIPRLQPTHLILLNYSRDQLDRYTEIDSLIERTINALDKSQTSIIYNAYNPYTLQLGRSVRSTSARQSVGYGVLSDQPITLLDQPVCWRCQRGIISYRKEVDRYQAYCPSCQLIDTSTDLTTDWKDGLLKIGDRAIGCPTPELAETLTATALSSQKLGIDASLTIQALERTPPLPAHERIFAFNETGTKYHLILAKNPASFNRVLARQRVQSATSLVLAINNRVVDGHDTSWLWDIDFEHLPPEQDIYITGDAAADLRLRLTVAGMPRLQRISSNRLADLSQSTSEVLIIANYTAYRDLEKLLKQECNDAPEELLRLHTEVQEAV